MGRLVGSATPSVVPPGTTVEVTFLVTAEGVTDWWIFVNPGSDNDGHARRDRGAANVRDPRQ